MREIKFRAWDEERREMIINEFTLHAGGIVTSFGVEVDWPIMQFTGLRDKNGREIYEDDIVRHVWDGDVMSHSGKRIFAVQQKPSARYLNFDCLAGKSSWELEVIGNTYENPELLK